MTAGDVIVKAEWEHMGYTYQIQTWRSDAHTYLRLVVREEPVDDSIGPIWQIVWMQ